MSVEGVPYALAIDQSQIYFSSLGPLSADRTWNTKVIDGSIWRANKDGTNARMLASGLYPPWAIAIDETDVFWVSADGIKRVSKGGGHLTPLVSWSVPPLPYTSDIRPGLHIAVDRESVFWVSCGTGSLTKITKRNGEPQTLASGLDCPFQLTLDAENVYWIDYQDDGSIMRISKDGTGPKQLLRNKGGLSGLVAAGKELFAVSGLDFFGRKPAMVIALSLETGTLRTVASNREYPAGIVADFRDIFWVEGPARSTLMRIDQAGGTPEVMLTGEMSISNIAVDDNAVYLTTAQRHAILRVEK